MDLSQEIKIITQIKSEDFQHSIWQTSLSVDCNNWIVLYLAMQMIQAEKLKLDQRIELEGSRQNNLFGSSKIQAYTVLELLQYIAFAQPPELALQLLHQLLGGREQAQIALQKELKKFKLDTQVQTIRELYQLAEAIFLMPIEIIQQVFQKQLSFKGNTLTPISSILTCSQLDTVLYLELANKQIYFSYRAENQTIGIFCLFDSIQRIDHIIPYYHYFTEGLIPSKSIQAKSGWINIIGDTYFGEFYTEIRKCKGNDDALQHYGYQHSFEKIKAFFNQNDLNIANFEAVFNLEKDSPLQDKKAFILGAEAKETIQEFKRIHLNTVCLGNNHLKDYGAASLRYTLQQFDEANIQYIGAGLDQQQAHQFFEVRTAQKTFAIFNGYWHRDIAYQDYDFYALGKSSGVACLNTILFEQIIHYKTRHPNHKVILICHWGVDFKTTHPEQESLAKLFTQIGVDLIIGHGAHTIQPIQYIYDKPVVFGIGNGVFNSNGEYKKHQALPYGIIARINLDEEIVQLYPIFTDNLETFWQPYPVSEKQFKQASGYLTQHLDQSHYQFKKNALGCFIELKI